MIRRGLTLLALGGLAIGAVIRVDAETPAPPARHTVADFAQLPLVENPTLSPDGTQIAAKIAIRGTQYFAILPVDGSPKRMVALGDNDLNWWRWVNDDWLVIGIGQTTDVQGDDWYITRAFGVNAKDTKIVKFAATQAGQDADDVIWTAHDGSPRILLSYQTSIYLSDPGYWPRIDEFDVSTGKRRRVLDAHEGVRQWYADGDGIVRMGIGHSADGRATRVLYRPATDKSFRVIDRAKTRDDAVMAPALFLPGGDKALMIADDDAGLSALYDFDLTTLERGKQLFASKRYDIGGLETDHTGYRLLGVRVNEEAPAIRWTDPDVAALEAEAGKLVKGATVRVVSLSRDHQRAIVRAGSAEAPGLLLLFDRKAGVLDSLAFTNETFRSRRLHPVRTIRYKARDGLEIAAVLTLPKGRKTGLPLIVLPHGGPFARDTEEWDWWTQFLADRGYAVVQPNYRGSSGYGTPFTAKGEGQWGLAMQDDLNDAVTSLAAQGIADPKRVCMVGASYGGYAAERAAQRDGPLFRCAIAYAGVSDLNAMMRYDGRFLGAGARKDWMRKQAPDLAAVSPVNYPEQFTIPLLVVHGAKDRVVPVRQSRALVQKLRKAGKPVEYLEQPLADHHFSRAEDRQSFLEAMEAFLTKHNPA
ncbi:S9 family peptidase [Sphingomonas sp. SUN019]|uniref:alpha/beta hydrolase family protein n=1 Tax=Sphingomonas sp. SUN019 TaxID=2937788 RepID=UPI0021643FF7|nr:S9 family peptidase [Sphingomonas sp. SUN019]UVO51531.1 S9 family peptidase [Sphingomonas sp. SUN019]